MPLKKLGENKNVLVSFFLRAGLAVVFLYAGIASLISPENWVGFIPQFIQNNFPTSILLILFSVYEISISLWLLSNKKIFYSIYCPKLCCNLVQLGRPKVLLFYFSKLNRQYLLYPTNSIQLM